MECWDCVRREKCAQKSLDADFLWSSSFSKWLKEYIIRNINSTTAIFCYTRHTDTKMKTKLTYSINGNSM